MLRNCNVTRGGLRPMYRPQTGVLGSLIPASGGSAASIMYPELSLPADADAEFSYWAEDLGTLPAGFLPLADDGSGTRGPYPDGSYSGTIALYRWDVRQFAYTLTLTQGPVTSVIVSPPAEPGPYWPGISDRYGNPVPITRSPLIRSEPRGGVVMPSSAKALQSWIAMLAKITKMPGIE